MLEKMIGVSPPQNVGQAKESKALSPHDLKDTAGNADFFSEFNAVRF